MGTLYWDDAQGVKQRSMLSSAAIIILAILVWGLLHPILASLSAKAWARERLGPTASDGYELHQA